MNAIDWGTYVSVRFVHQLLLVVLSMDRDIIGHVPSDKIVIIVLAYIVYAFHTRNQLALSRFDDKLRTRA